MTTSKRGQTRFDRGWTRYNCLTKGYVIPEWAREENEGQCAKERYDNHNTEVIQDGRRREENKDDYFSERSGADGKRT